MRSPLLTAVGAGAGTFVTLTFVTGAVSGVALSVAKRVLRHRKMAVATKCSVCDASGFMSCQVCMGKAIIRCRQPVSLKQLRRRSRPAAAGEGGEAGGVVHCACPGCGTTRLQRCLNCLGDGKVCLPS